MGVMLFLVKNCGKRNAVWAGVHVNHPSWHGQRRWKSLQKNSLPPNTAFHNTSWYTDTDGFLEHSPSRGSLYYKGPTHHKITPISFGYPLVDWPLLCHGCLSKTSHHDLDNILLVVKKLRVGRQCWSGLSGLPVSSRDAWAPALVYGGASPRLWPTWWVLEEASSNS